MSKSKGNVIDPWKIFSTHGADALRWYFFSSGQPWTTRRVSRRRHPRGDPPDAAHAVERLLVLRHLRRPRRLDPDTDRREPRRRHLLDRWILGELGRHGRRSSPTRSSASTRSPAATRIATFVDDLSNWYVRRSRPRFWKSSDPHAHATLYRVPRHERAAARAVLPVPLRRDLRRAHRRALGPHVRLAEPRARSDPALAAEMEAVRRLVTARSGRPHRGEGKGAPAAAARPAAAPGRRALRTRRAPRSPTSSTSRRSTTSTPCRAS